MPYHIMMQLVLADLSYSSAREFCSNSEWQHGVQGVQKYIDNKLWNTLYYFTEETKGFE